MFRLKMAFGLFVSALKGGEDMMAMLMAVRIVEGKYDYNRVPKLLKAQVDECLTSLGFKVVDGQLVPLEAE